MRAFLLAAGFGTRLWPLSDVRAKPAFPYLGQPLIAHVAAHAVRHGASRLVVNTHHLPQSVHDALASFDHAPVTFVHEPEILGTAGALVNARELLESDEPVVVINAKVITNIDLSRIVAAHQASQAPVTMVCVPNQAREKFTHVQFSSTGTLEGFVPAERLAEIAAPYVFTGIQVLSRAFFRYLCKPGFSDTVKDVYPAIQAAGDRVHVVAASEQWAEFSTLLRYRQLQGAHVDPSARVANSAVIEDSIVWPGATIGERAELRRCIVADGVTIPEDMRLNDVAIIQAERVTNTKDARVERGLVLARI